MDVLKNLSNGILTTDVSPIYTVPENTVTIVKEIILKNGSTLNVPALITFSCVSNGDTVIVGQDMPPQSTYIIELHSILNSGFKINGMGSSTNAINCYISGIEVTPDE